MVIAVTGTLTAVIFVYVQLYLQPFLSSTLPSFLPVAVVYALIGVSFLSIFTALYFFVNVYFWKSLFGRMLFRIPDFSGVWTGTLERTDHETKQQEAAIPVELHIEQTFSQIAIMLINDDPKSASGRTRSEATAVRINGNPNQCSIEHIFKFKDGWGSSELVLRRDGRNRVLEGHYISSIPRKGFIRVTRVRRK